MTLNWRNIKFLSEDDYEKPLLFQMYYDADNPVNYFAGEIRDGAVFAFAYVDEHGKFNKYLMSVAEMPVETYYVRIDNIKF